MKNLYTKTDKNGIKALFQSIAPTYDVINNLMSLGLQSLIKKSFIKDLPIQNPQLILDACCGSGDLLVFLADKYPNSNIKGLDFSTTMLKIASKKLSSCKNVSLAQFDMTELHKQKIAPDLITIGFGLRNLPNVDTFLKEAYKKLAPGGTLAILDMGQPNKIIKPFYSIYLNKIIPTIASLISKNESAYRYLGESLKLYPTQKEMIQKLKNIGFINAKNKNYLFGTIATQIAQKPTE
ncbi:MAG: ubiquinone/menaquinone biosynthesis methyltransferase [Candidatus Gastranaerophilales bacterium]|nr:ubiquinone/menaquinone biosynthesis methyltransferase [Candidatus Gastranaerophilales bacterium]